MDASRLHQRRERASSHGRPKNERAGKMNYQQHSLAGLNGIELIIALYDGMVRFMYRAIDAIEAADVHARRRSIKRVFDILIHLQARLRMDVGGTPAQALSEFYAAMFALALQGSQQQSTQKLLEAIACIRNVREAWQQVALDPAAQRMLPRNLQTVEERINAATLPAVRSEAEVYAGGDGGLPESCRWMA
jgi:flagellar protein FliS